ncbi:MAG: J domain-containing protein [Nitrospirota bacterium]
MDYDKLKKAVEIFGLFDGISLKEIKKRHRELAKKYHPDSGNGDAELMKEINIAYKVMLGYCESYRYSFSEEEFYRQHPEELIRKRFMSDPIWGDGR